MGSNSCLEDTERTGTEFVLLELADFVLAVDMSVGNSFGHAQATPYVSSFRGFASSSWIFASSIVLGSGAILFRGTCGSTQSSCRDTFCSSPSLVQLLFFHAI